MRVFQLPMRSGFGCCSRIFRPLGLLEAVIKTTLVLGVFLGVLNSSQVLAAEGSYLDREDVNAWVKETVAETDLDLAYIRSQLALATKQEKVLERISAPAEKTLTWGEYRKIFIQQKRIAAGREFLDENRELFKQAEARFGVPSAVVAAIIGVETFYGRYKGKDQALSALATLAFDYPRRGKFFRRELREFLLLAQEESFEPSAIRGSYAAAMGMPQFISSSYRSYAVDFDGDGRRDLWKSKADIIGSVANYLATHGWVENEPVAEQVRPDGKAYRKLIGKELLPDLRRKQLHAAGVKTKARSIKEKSLMELQAIDGKQVWVGFHNFYVITRYNRSRLYALAVHELSKALNENS